MCLQCLKEQNLEYENIHCHSFYSNIMTPDSVTSREDVAKRAVELGHKTISTVEHGYGGNVFDFYTIAKKYDLKLIFGTEFYYVKDRFEKDKTNAHILVVAKNENGREAMNMLISEANETGFYMKPRIDESLLFSLPKDDVIVTTACVASPINKYEGYADYFIPKAKEYFGDNFFLEVQPHTHDLQIEFNTRLLEYREKYDVPLILGIDSHYIYEKDADYRDIFLKSKNIHYPEEDGFILDFPEVNTIIDRFEQQDVLNKEQLTEAFNNTLIARDFEGVQLNTEIKMISIYPDLTHEEKVKKLKELINQEWVKDREHIPKSKWKEYIEAIKFEIDIIVGTKMEDYFLFNHKMIKKGVEEYGGILTKTGRGCFTETALVHTRRGLIPIKDVVVGDFVINKFGEWDKVINTWKYNIDEPMIEIQYLYGSNFSPVISTLDHKILVRDKNNQILYKQAKDLDINNDYVCCPILKQDGNSNDVVIDLSQYANDTNIIQDDFILERDSKKQYTKKIKRYIKLDSKFYYVLGMLYGDGWVRLTDKRGVVGLALNTHNHKNIINREAFEEFAKYLNVDIYENKSKTKKLSQMIINSKILARFFKENYFISKKGEDKNVPQSLLDLSYENSESLYQGLIDTDGSIGEDNRIAFDNTNKKLIHLVKTLDMKLGNNPKCLMKRSSKIDKRGYNTKDSYKLRGRIGDGSIILQNKNKFYKDGNYFFLPISKLIIHKSEPKTVYDLQIENDPSFTIYNMVVHNSAPSMYVNKLFGFTEVDRLEAPIELYPTRFMSKSRILETKSLPDIDFNTSNSEPFLRASKDIIGEKNCYQMITFGTMQDKDAFKYYCRGLGLPLNEVEVISEDLDSYKTHKQWGKIIKRSQKFIGVIISYSPHNCSTLLLNENIQQKVGTIKAKDGQQIALIDSYNSDVYKYLKNDLLTVTVYGIIGNVYKAIGKPIDDVRTLIKNTKDDERIWKLFEDGIVATLNQAGTNSGKPQIMQYKPRSIRDLSMWVAAIRPSFATLKDTFLNRVSFTYNIPELDKLLETSDNFILFQENIMTVLQYAGFPEDETYGLLKAIAKKKPGIIEPIHDRFIKGFVDKTGSENDALEVWKIIENAVGYGFNSSHAYSVALDCLYGAYLKVNYPLEYYTETLNIYANAVDKQGYLIEELPYFNIKLQGLEFGNSKGDYTFQRETNSIYKGIGTIKYLNNAVAVQLQDFYDNNDIENMHIVDIFRGIIDGKVADNRQMNILIQLGYFSKLGNSDILLELYNTMTGYQSKKALPQFLKHVDNPKFGLKYSTTLKSKEQRIENLKVYYDYLLSSDILGEHDIRKQLEAELEYCGYIFSRFDTDENNYYVLSVNAKYTPIYKVYNLFSGVEEVFKLEKKLAYNENNELLFNKGDLIQVLNVKLKPKNSLVNGKWVQDSQIMHKFFDKVKILEKI